jgi:hypothetical protein
MVQLGTIRVHSASHNPQRQVINVSATVLLVPQSWS